MDFTCCQHQRPDVCQSLFSNTEDTCVSFALIRASLVHTCFQLGPFNLPPHFSYYSFDFSFCSLPPSFPYLIISIRPRHRSGSRPLNLVYSESLSSSQVPGWSFFLGGTGSQHSGGPSSPTATSPCALYLARRLEVSEIWTRFHVMETLPAFLPLFLSPAFCLPSQVL